MFKKLENPLVSVVMPVYNDQRFLQESLLSIRNQTYKNLEFIIVNDGSSDKSAEIITNNALEDKRIIAINQNHSGLTKAFNKGISISRGNLIAIQDSDDVSLPERIEKEIEFLSKNEEYGLVGSRWRLIDEHGRALEQMVPFLNSDKQLRNHIFSFNPFCHSSFMLRREVIDKIGDYNENFLYAQDYHFIIRIMRHFKVYNLDDVLVLKRRHSGAISVKYTKKQFFYIIKAKKFAINYLRLPWIFKLKLLKDIIVYLMPDRVLLCYENIKKTLISRRKVK